MIRVPILEPIVTTTDAKGIITIDVGLKVSSNFDYAHLDTLNFISFVTIISILKLFLTALQLHITDL